MEAKVQKWGHSLALRIPSAFAKHARIQPGSRVDIPARQAGRSPPKSKISLDLLPELVELFNCTFLSRPPFYLVPVNVPFQSHPYRLLQALPVIPVIERGQSVLYTIG